MDSDYDFSSFYISRKQKKELRGYVFVLDPLEHIYPGDYVRILDFGRKVGYDIEKEKFSFALDTGGVVTKVLPVCSDIYSAIVYVQNTESPLQCTQPVIRKFVCMGRDGSGPNGPRGKPDTKKVFMWKKQRLGN
jgi:hypothetical protein